MTAVLQHQYPGKSGCILCNNVVLDKGTATEFQLSGDVHFRDLKQYAEVCHNTHACTRMCACTQTHSHILVLYLYEDFHKHNTLPTLKPELLCRCEKQPNFSRLAKIRFELECKLWCSSK